MAKSSKRKSWWSFAGSDKGPATGEFSASGWRDAGPLYFPLMNEAGMLSWVSPSLQGGPAQNHHAYLGLPQSIEDMPHSLVHRGFWLAEKGRTPFALSDLSPDGLKGQRHLLVPGRPCGEDRGHAGRSHQHVATSA